MRSGNVLVLIFASAAIAGALTAQPLTIDHSPISCLPEGCGRTKIIARVNSETEPRVVRVYFRAADKASEYYIEMLRTASNDYWAVLPLPAETTKVISYRVAAIDSTGREISTESYSVPVTETCPELVLTRDEQRVASNLALGLTSSTQPAAPAGFRCTGVTNEISADGEVLRTNDACSQIRLASKDECDLLPPMRRITTAQAAGLVAIGGAVAVGGAMIYQDNQDGDGPAVSNIRPNP